MGEAPTFAEFYQAVHGRPPFPWQERLARHVLERGWPEALAVPTGLGKTAAIDVGVWALAVQADVDPSARTAPTRIWYVVNRRLLVDAAAMHADQLRALLEEPPSPVLGEIARRLASVHEDAGRPLWVSRLRGGAGAWLRPPTPAQPAVLCATVPMYASRLLFRGYGTSSRMWPVDAALAGCDAVVLLDESHLAPGLIRLLDQAAQCDASRVGVLRPLGRGRPLSAEHVLPSGRVGVRLVELSATTASEGDRFELDDADRGHPVIARRLAAAKPTNLIDVTSDHLVEVMARECRTRLEALGGGVAIAFVNRPRTARELANTLAGDDLDVEVLTGQLRDADADDVRTRLLDPDTGAPAGRPAGLRARPLVIIATQTLEVGADLDADVVVTEAAGVRALIQRFGRLNRLGERPHANGAILFPDKPDPLYGAEPAAVRERLRGEGPVDLGPGRIADALGPPQDTSSTYLPELLPNHLWEFAKTGPAPVDAAPPEVFFAGLDDEDLTVTVAWRAVLPVDGGPLVPPLHSAETVEIPIGEARRGLAGAVGALCLSPDGASSSPLDAGAIRPGDRIVLPCTDGGYGPQGWDPDSREPVRDLSARLRHQIHLCADALSAAAGDQPDEDVLAALHEIVTSASSDDEPPQLAVGEVPDAVATWLRDHGVLPADATALPLVLPPGAAVAVLRWQQPGVHVPVSRIDALDELSVAELCQLDVHLATVGEVAERLARRLGMPDPLVAAVRQAGCLHDLGKADRRFQRWLGNPDGPPVAKSRTNEARWQAARQAAGWPQAARHELLSNQLIDAGRQAGLSLVDEDLVRHLVVSHHGHGRPTLPTPGDSAPLRTTVSVDGISASAFTDPSAPAADQPARFRRLCERFGYWQLALLEATLRQADHLVSAVTEVA